MSAVNGYVVLNSEVHPWLGKTLKPDFSVLPDAFWSSCARDPQKIYPEGKFGIVRDSRVFDTVRCVIDGKITQGDSTFVNEARGQILDYAISLRSKEKVHGIHLNFTSCILKSMRSLTRSFLSFCRASCQPKS